jgi:hypothetical protein
MRFALIFTLLVGVVATRAEAGRGTALVKYLADDTSVVVVSDVARGRNSPIFKKLFKLAREQNAWLDSLASATPVDKQVDTIVIGSNGSEQAIAVLEGRIDKLLAEAKKNSTKTETHAGVTYWVTSDGEVAVIDKKLFVTSAGAMTGVIDRAKNKKAKGPGAVRTILASTQAGTAVFGGLVLTASQRAELNKSLGAEPQWVAFSVAMAQKLTLDARLRFADDATAAKVAKSINDQLTPDRRGQLEALVGKEFSDSITVDQQQSFARLAATMTPEEVEKLITFAKVML